MTYYYMVRTSCPLIIDEEGIVHSKIDSVEYLTQEEEPKHKGTFDGPLPQPKYEPPKIMLV